MSQPFQSRSEQDGHSDAEGMLLQKETGNLTIAQYVQCKKYTLRKHTRTQ